MEAGSTKAIGPILVEGADINMQEVRSPGKGSQAEAEMKVISTIGVSGGDRTGGTGGEQAWEMATGDNILDGCCCSVLEQKRFLRWNVSEGFKKIH